jgi:hypothetical protein
MLFVNQSKAAQYKYTRTWTTVVIVEDELFETEISEWIFYHGWIREDEVTHYAWETHAFVVLSSWSLWLNSMRKRERKSDVGSTATQKMTEYSDRFDAAKKRRTKWIRDWNTRYSFRSNTCLPLLELSSEEETLTWHRQDHGWGRLKDTLSSPSSTTRDQVFYTSFYRNWFMYDLVRNGKQDVKRNRTKLSRTSETSFLPRLSAITTTISLASVLVS